MKQILILQAGRPKGNTARLSEAVAEGAREAGHRVEIVQLNTLDIRGCLGCNACRYQRPCVQRDDFAAVREKIEAADCLIFASPLYFWTISARLKAVIERFYCLAAEDPAPPFGRYEAYPEKDCALLLTAADDLFWTFEQAVSYYRFALVQYIGLHDRGIYLAGGCGSTTARRPRPFSSSAPKYVVSVRWYLTTRSPRNTASRRPSVKYRSTGKWRISPSGP